MHDKCYSGLNFKIGPQICTFNKRLVVINSHMSQIVNLPLTKGTSVEKVQEFYDILTRSYDALETLGESEMLKGLVLTTLNKLPHIKPDIVRTDDSWEEWGMKDLIDNIHKWLKRNRTGGSQSPREVSQKGKNIGLCKRPTKNSLLQKNPENQFVCFVKKITGETLALSMTL